MRPSHTPLVWLALLLGLCPAHAQSPAGEIAQLASGQQIDLFVDSRHSSNIRLTPDRGASAQLIVSTDEPTLVLKVVAAGRNKIRSLQAGYAGWLSLSFPVTATTTYSLVIEAPGALTSDVKVGLTLERGQSTGKSLDSQMEAENLLCNAQSMRSQLTASSLRQALVLDQRAERIWLAAGNKSALALVHMAKADTQMQLDSYANALREYALAAPFIKHETSLQVALLNGQTRAYLEWWKQKEALSLAETALLVSRRINDITGEAFALANRGEAEYLLTQEAGMTADLRDALTVGKATRNRLAIAHALRIQSWVARDSSNLAEGSRMMRESGELFQQTGDQRNALWELFDIANDDNLSGDSYSAILRQIKIAGILHDAGDVTAEADAYDCIGVVYLDLNRPGDALDYFLRADKLLKSIGSIWNNQSSVNQICATELTLGHTKSAVGYCNESKRLALVFNVPYFESEADLHLGIIAELRGENNQALTYYEQAARLTEKIHYPIGQAAAVIKIGLLKDKLGEHAAAMAAFKNAFSVSQAADDQPGMLKARYQLARSQSKAGLFPEARQELDLALAAFESRRGKVHDEKLRTSYFAAARKCYDLYVDILMRQHAVDPAAGFDRQAFEKSEAGRARTLLDALAARKEAPAQDRPIQANPELARFKNELNEAYEKRLNLIVRGTNEQEIQRNESEIRRLAAAYDQAGDLAREQTKASTTEAHPLSVSQLLAGVPADSIVLEYSLGEPRSYVWQIEHGNLTARVLPDRQTIVAAVGKWRDLVAARQRRPGESFAAFRVRVQSSDRELPKQSAALSCMLLGDLQENPAQRILVISDGILQSVPFAALPLQGCKEGPGAPLVTAYEILNAPSLAVLLSGAASNVASSSSTGDVAILADPVFSPSDPRVGKHVSPAGQATASPLQSALRDVGFGTELPRLTATRLEAQAIASAVPGAKLLLATDFKANLQTALSDELSQYRIWHFATHGLLDAKSPDLSGIVFSLVDTEGHPTPGYLKTQDIFDLSIHPELVVLSACSSGLGEQIDGEGTVGLSYAFLHAGARQVVSTLWNVDDQASSELMAEFYRQLLSRALTPSAALRQAQKKILSARHNSEAFYWAGYILTSN